MIEDNATNLQLMAYLLTRFGHAVSEATEGAMGLELARRERPDLILLDIHMPRMDGYEVARHLKEDLQCREIPLVAVTALAMVGDREKILSAGFSGYISKPLDPQTFTAEVEPYLPKGVAPEEPRRPADTKVNHVDEGKESGATRPLVLFVDNSPTNTHLAQSLLEPNGYRVVTARSAAEGYAAAKRARPDLIVSDVHMPHQDGYDFIRMIQADRELSRIPFVFLSSSVWSTREQQQALTLGALRFISRPIDPATLLSELEACLKQEGGSRGKGAGGG